MSHIKTIAEKRYWQAMLNAANEHMKNLKDAMCGNREDSGPSLYDLERKHLIMALEIAAAKEE